MASQDRTDRASKSGKRRIGGYLLVQEDEHAVTYVLIPTLRWIYFLILLSWGVVIVTGSIIALALVGLPTIVYFALVWWPSRSIRSQIQAAARGGWVEFKGTPLSHSNPATYRIAKVGHTRT
jgi:hypothetical protein